MTADECFAQDCHNPIPDGAFPESQGYPFTSTNSVAKGITNVIAGQNAHLLGVVIPTERHTPAVPAAVIVQIRHPRLDYTSIHPGRRHIALQK